MMINCKGAGVVALTLFDLRRRGKVGRLGLCGVNGKKVSVLLYSRFHFGLNSRGMNLL